MLERPIAQKNEKITSAGFGALENKFLENKDARLILNKLEKGELDRFDGRVVQLLAEVLKDKNKITILTTLNRVMPSLLLVLGPKVAGIMAAVKGAEIGEAYFRGRAEGYVNQKGSEYLSALLLDIKKWLPFDEAGWFASFEKSVNARVAEVVLGVNEHITKQGSAVIQEVAGKTGELAGSIAEVPSGVAGFLAGSMLTGGILGVFRETRRSNDFSQIQEFIERSDTFIKNAGVVEGDDPRLSLLALFEKISKDTKRMGHKLKNEEWVRLAVAVRAARSSLLREKTMTPKIIAADEVKNALERQSRITEAIIDSQGEMAEIDLGTAAEILSQFDALLAKDIDPVEKRFKNYNNLLNKTWRYSRAFVVSGVNATGIPMLYKMARFGASMAHKGLKIAFPIP